MAWGQVAIRSHGVRVLQAIPALPPILAYHVLRGKIKGGNMLLEDLQLKDKRIFEMVMEEQDRQIKKWGVQIRHPFEWLAYTTEEHGELAEAISEFVYREGLQSNVIKEAIQEATLCLKIAEMLLNYDKPIIPQTR